MTKSGGERAAGGGRRRRPYKSPKIQTDKVYERYGLACGKSNPMDANCLKNTMTS